MDNDNKQSARVRSLTQEQIDWLKTCPHVVSFTGKRIFWSKKLLDEFCEEYDKGESATEILKRKGIDLSILGPSRAAMFRNYYSETWRPTHYNLPEVARATYRKDSAEARVKPANNKTEMKFNHRLKYLEQEVEFLKKIFEASHKLDSSKPAQP